VCRERPELWEGRKWILHHDNAPAHSPLIVREFFGAQFHHRVRTSPLLAGFSPLRFFLVPQMQIGAAGAAFGDVTIKSETTSLLKGLRGIPRVLPAMETEVGQMYCV